ncbi:Methyltransferase domain-containing protein [Klenkia soli]|uniref:Methyltransferase domain-containing protein n=1 Tax=Klenkia soli TaxID=1052260 RepID=A0A1H0J211_9ACTN|nr:methyltransferase domain-containing protein [Klenkia soli]SDO37777.1 Methyltransferase domain-containing protein [Klenkia soli]
MTADERCPSCGATGTTLLRDRDTSGHGYVRCTGCGLGRIDPLPAPTALAAVYDEDYFVAGGARGGYQDYEADARVHRRTAQRRLDRVDRHAGAPVGRPVLVDVGAATGHLASVAAARGWDPVAVEPSRWAAERARGRGLTVVPTLDEVDRTPGSVDVVTFFQSLEHVPDPVADLARAAELLRPGGWLVCETWDLSSRTARAAGAGWQQLTAPSVLWLLDPPSGARLVRGAGLEPVSWRRSPKSVSLATVLGQLASSAPAAVGRALQRAVPLTSRVPVPYPLDDLVTFVARRPPG